MLLAVVWLWAAPVGAQERESDFPAPVAELYAELDTLDCTGVSVRCRQIIPTLVFDAYPDSLVDLVYYWEDACGLAEPITRTLILGAIWDGAFSEDLYGDEIIDFLIWYNDPRRLLAAEDYLDPEEQIDPNLASGGVASPADFGSFAGQYDAFTADLADQLLPHVPLDTPEHFFCLFYSGNSDAAWALLSGETLKGTYLKRIYDWEQERLGLERAPANYLFTAGYWMPSGNLELVGNHLNLGVMSEQRGQKRFWRITADLLIGRSENPYQVNKPEISARSDRFNALATMIEGGWQPWQRGHNGVDLYAGAGLEFLLPFLDVEEDESIVLVNVKGLLGVGFRRTFGGNQKWGAHLDLRREWIPNRNDGGTALDGQAWSIRFAFGFNRNHDLDRRLRVLEQ